jgi:predicted homoserine dehydrogenase-like protein
VEATISILSAAILQRSTLGDTVRPRVDLVARATRDLPAGTRLAVAHHHTHALADMQPMLMPAAPAALDDSAPLPYYMAVDQVLSRAVRAGEMLTAAALHKPVASALWRLRAVQDQRFLSNPPAGTIA